MWIADGWRDYELLDCGNGEKLERWDRHFLVRPLEDGRHAPLGRPGRVPSRPAFAAAAVAARAGHQDRAHQVPVPGAAPLGGMDEQLGTAAAVFPERADETAAVAQGAVAAGHGQQAFRPGPESAGKPQELPFAGKGGQFRLQPLFPLARDAGRAQKAVQAQGARLAVKNMQQFFTCGNRVPRVAAALFSGVFHGV